MSKVFFSEYRFLREVRRGEHVEFVDSEQAAVSRLNVLHQELMFTGGGLHFFITTRDLALMIAGMVRDFDMRVLDYLADLTCPGKLLRDKAGACGCMASAIIHPPSPLPAILFGVSDVIGEKNALFQTRSYRGEIVALGPANFESGHSVNLDALDPSVEIRPSHEIILAMKMVVGLALYAKFFPQCVLNAFPESAKHPNHYKGLECKSVSMAAELIEPAGDHSCPTPHVRKAHFRFLQSERFTNKKGQIVLVRQSFVRGKCKIVVEPLPPAE